MTEYVGMSIGTDKDIPRPSYSISDDSAKRDSLRFNLAVSCKRNKFGNILNLSELDMIPPSNARDQVDSDEYLDMSCGST